MDEINKLKASAASGEPPTREDRIAGLLYEILGDAPVFMVANGRAVEIASHPVIMPPVVSEDFDNNVHLMFVMTARQSAENPDGSINWNALPSVWEAFFKDSASVAAPPSPDQAVAHHVVGRPAGLARD